VNDDYEDGYSAGWDAADKSAQDELTHLRTRVMELEEAVLAFNEERARLRADIENLCAENKRLRVDIQDENDRLSAENERMLQALRIAVLPLAHAAEADSTYQPAYEAVSEAIARAQLKETKNG
jgi:regulator of replication initiation timing